MPILFIKYSINSFNNIKEIQSNDEKEVSNNDINISTKKSQKHLDKRISKKNLILYLKSI